MKTEKEILDEKFTGHIRRLRLIADTTEKQLPSKFLQPRRRALLEECIAGLREDASNLEDIMDLWV